MAFTGGKKTEDLESYMDKYSQFLSPGYLKKYDKEVKKKNSPSLFMRALSLLTTGESAPGVYEAISKNDPLAGVSGYLKGIGSSVMGTGLQNKTYRDVLELIGMDRTALSEKLPFLYNETGKGWQFKKGGFVDPTDTGTLGLALDILGDPKTYMVGAGLFMRVGKGMSGLTRVGKELWIEAGEKAAREAAETAAKKGLSSGATRMLESKLIQDASELLIKSFKKEPDKYFSGITFLGQNVIPRKAALFPGMIIDKTMSTVPVVNKVYSGVKNGIQDMFVAFSELSRTGKAAGFSEDTVEKYTDMLVKLEKNKTALMADVLTNAEKTWRDVRKLASRKDIEASLDDIADQIERGLAANGYDRLPREAVEKLVNLSKETSDAFIKGETDAAKRLGLEAAQIIENYFPHERTEYAKKAMINSGEYKSSFAKGSSTKNDEARVFKVFKSETGEEISGRAEKEGLQKYSRIAEERFIKKHNEILIDRRGDKLAELGRQISLLDDIGSRLEFDTFLADITGRGVKEGTKSELTGVNKMIDYLSSLPEKELARIEKNILTADVVGEGLKQTINRNYGDLINFLTKIPSSELSRIERKVFTADIMGEGLKKKIGRGYSSLINYLRDIPKTEYAVIEKKILKADIIGDAIKKDLSVSKSSSTSLINYLKDIPKKEYDIIEKKILGAKLTGEAIKEGVKVNKAGINNLLNDLMKIPEKEYKAISRKLVSKDKTFKKLLDEISDLRADIKEKIYKLPENDIYYKDAAGKIYKEERNMTVNEINAKMQLFMDANGQKGKKYMMTDPLEAAMARGQRSAGIVARRNFLADVVQEFGQKGEIETFYTRIPGTRKTKLEKKVMGKNIDGLEYVDASSIKELPDGTLLPKFIFDDLKKFDNITRDDKIVTKLVNAYDKALNVFKGSVYGWYPASHGRNAIGGFFNDFLANPKSFRYIGEKPHKIIYGNPDELIQVGKLEFKVSEIRDMIKETGILGQTGIYDVNQSLTKLKRGALSKFGGAPMAAMEFVENNVRLPLFLAELAEGKSAKEAAKTVFRYHFDYAPEALSEFERNVMRRLIPFYRWTRGNIPLMLEEMISQPGKMTGTFKFIRDMSDDQGNLDRSLLPSYQESEAPVMKGGQAIGGLGLPPIEMLKYLTDFKKQAESGVTPFIKIPVELRTNYSLFKDKVISEDVNGNFAANYPDAVKEWLEWEDTSYEKDGKKITNSRVNPSKKYMLYALPSGRMASMFSSVMDETEANKLLRQISGIRTIEVDKQRLKEQAEYQFDKKILEIFEDAGVFSKYGKPYKVYSDQVK